MDARVLGDNNIYARSVSLSTGVKTPVLWYSSTYANRNSTTYPGTPVSIDISNNAMYVPLGYGRIAEIWLVVKLSGLEFDAEYTVTACLDKNSTSPDYQYISNEVINFTSVDDKATFYIPLFIFGDDIQDVHYLYTYITSSGSTHSIDADGGLYERYAFLNGENLTNVGLVRGEQPLTPAQFRGALLENPENLIQTDSNGYVKVNPYIVGGR